MGNLVQNKWYLYMTEFFAGMSVMAVELGASRLLAPYFSSSQIVWTIIIGTIMIAMALGNIWGGRMADKNPDPGKLYARILVAAVWIAAIPLLGRYVILAVSAALIFTVSHNFLVLAAFVACMLIFVFPLFLLGTVTPSLAKYTMNNLSDNGKIVGTLGAFNTIGSILGTFLPTFVTIPAVGTSITFLLFSGILLLIGLAYFIGRRERRRACVTASALFLVCTLLGHDGSFAFWEQNLLYEGESIYNYLQVKETDDSVILSTNVLFGVQSIRKKDDSLTGMYYDYAMAAPVLAASGRAYGDMEVLVLGMGTGTFGSQCRRYFDGISVEGVEIDEKITGLAGAYFELPPEVPVATYDGRAYLQAVDKKYDVIMVDAYQDITIPFQMSTVEFFTQVKEHLKDNGVMVVNMNMQSEEAGSINEYLTDTIASVFPAVQTVNVAGATNRELFAALSEEPFKGFAEETAALSDEELSSLMVRVEAGFVQQEAGGNILTDDKAPVELLGMRMIDGLIQEEISYYKNIYDREGIAGLLRETGL